MQEFAQNKLTTIVIVCLYIGSCLIHTFHQFHGGENVSSITWNAAPAPQILRSQMSSDKSVLLELDIDMKLESLPPQSDVLAIQELLAIVGAKKQRAKFSN